MAAFANPLSESVPLIHVFSELPVSSTQNCGVCHKAPAVYRWTEQGGSSDQHRGDVICRVCASMVVLVGKPT